MEWYKVLSVWQSKRRKLAILGCIILIVIVSAALVTTLVILPMNRPVEEDSFSYTSRDISFSSDVALAPSSSKLSKFLVLFFPGTRGGPKNYSTFLTHLTKIHNHRVISLSYNNNVSGFVYCRNSSSTSGCYEAMRENQIFGKTSDNLGLLVQRGFKATDQQLVVVDRLKRVLAELNEKYPQDRWSDFIQINSSNNEKDVKWEKVLAMGHSQGAAIAAFLGSQLQIAGVRQFAGPSDVYSDGVTAGYITMPSATTKSLWRTFRSRYDVFCGAVSTITTALGYQNYGSPVDIEPPPATKLNHYTNDFCSNSCFNTIPKDSVPMTTHSNFIQDSLLNSNGGNRKWCFDYKLLWEEFGKVEECDQVNCVGNFYCNPALGCIKKEIIYRNETSEGCQCRKP